MIQVVDGRHQEPIAGEFAFVEVDHFYQDWNNCGSHIYRHVRPPLRGRYDPLCHKASLPAEPLRHGHGLGGSRRVAGGKLGQEWKLVAFSNDDAGFDEGTGVIRRHLDAGRPVVIDFTVIRNRDGKEERFGHTLLVAGYHSGRGLVQIPTTSRHFWAIMACPAGDG